MKVLAVTLALVVSSVSYANDYEEFVEKPGWELMVPVFKLRLGGEAVAQSEDELFKRRYCTLAKQGHGIPIVIDRKLREEAKAALGHSKARRLLLPVARANNAVRCYCASAEQKAKLNCG